MARAGGGWRHMGRKAKAAGAPPQQKKQRQAAESEAVAKSPEQVAKQANQAAELTAAALSPPSGSVGSICMEAAGCWKQARPLLSSVGSSQPGTPVGRSTSRASDTRRTLPGDSPAVPKTWSQASLKFARATVAKGSSRAAPSPVESTGLDLHHERLNAAVQPDRWLDPPSVSEGPVADFAIDVGVGNVAEQLVAQGVPEHVARHLQAATLEVTEHMQSPGAALPQKRSWEFVSSDVGEQLAHEVAAAFEEEDNDLFGDVPETIEAVPSASAPTTPPLGAARGSPNNLQRRGVSPIGSSDAAEQFADKVAAELEADDAVLAGQGPIAAAPSTAQADGEFKLLSPQRPSLSEQLRKRRFSSPSSVKDTIDLTVLDAAPGRARRAGEGGAIDLPVLDAHDEQEKEAAMAASAFSAAMSTLRSFPASTRPSSSGCSVPFVSLMDDSDDGQD